MTAKEREGGGRERESYLVSWCFKPSQPQRIKSELRETFTKRYTAERTNMVKIRPEEQREYGELSGEFME